MNFAPLDIDLDLIAIFYQTQRAADRRLGGDMQHASAISRATHAAIRNADHIAHTFLQQFFRDRKHAPFRHAGRANRPGILQHQNRVLINFQIRIVDAQIQIGVVFKDDGFTNVLMKFWISRCLFDNAAIGGEIAPQDRCTALMIERIIQ